MTWLVTGADGQLGRAFRRALAGRDDTRFVDRSACDLSNPASLADCLARQTPSIIINCAAYTAVDAAEQDAQTAMRVNAQAVGDMARWAADRDALMVHFSTDYVFDGAASGAYAEDSPVNPLSAYGRSKAAGEAEFLESRTRGVCLRTSWVHSNDGRNFLVTMKSLMKERDQLRIVNDQHGVPTTTDFLATTTLSLVDLLLRNDNDLPRLIHAVPGGATSWFGLATHIRNMLLQQDSDAKIAEIQAIHSSEFPQTATRPANSVMSNSLLQSLLGKTVAGWEAWHDKLHGR